MEKGYEIRASTDYADQEKLMDDFFEIDRICYGDIADEDQGTREYWLAISGASLKQVLSFEGKSVGMIHFLRVTREGAAKIKSGALRDGDVGSFADTARESGDTDLYLVSAVILPKHRGKGMAKKLWNSARQRIAEKKISVRSISATVWSESGRMLLEPLGPETVAHDIHGHAIVSIRSRDGLLPEFR